MIISGCLIKVRETQMTKRFNFKCNTSTRIVVNLLPEQLAKLFLNKELFYNSDIGRFYCST